MSLSNDISMRIYSLSRHNAKPLVRRIYFFGVKGLRPRTTSFLPFLFVKIMLSKKRLFRLGSALIIIFCIFGEKRLPSAKALSVESVDVSIYTNANRVTVKVTSLLLL